MKREVSECEARGAPQQAESVFHRYHHDHRDQSYDKIKLKAQQIEQTLTVIDHIAFLFVHGHWPKHRLVTDRGMQL